MHSSDGWPTSPNLRGFFRQYMGATIAGDRRLCVNGFSRRLWRSLRRSLDLPSNWREEPLDVCDGGYSHWRAEYSVQDGAWSNFRHGGRS